MGVGWAMEKGTWEGVARREREEEKEIENMEGCGLSKRERESEREIVIPVG